MALCDCKIRVSKETLLEQIEVCLILLVLRRIFYNKINNFSIHLINGRSTKIVAARKTVFNIAISTGLMVAFINGKCTTALTE